VATGRELRTLAHPEGVDAVAFSPDGRLALTLSGDGTVKLWEVATGRELRTLAGHSVTSVAFSPNGRLALTGSRDGTATLWEVATGRELRTLAGIRAKFTRSPSRRMAGWR
jgi:WD40 repeat protein